VGRGEDVAPFKPRRSARPPRPQVLQGALPAADADHVLLRAAALRARAGPRALLPARGRRVPVPDAGRRGRACRGARRARRAAPARTVAAAGAAVRPGGCQAAEPPARAASLATGACGRGCACRQTQGPQHASHGLRGLVPQGSRTCARPFNRQTSHVLGYASLQGRPFMGLSPLRSACVRLAAAAPRCATAVVTAGSAGC